MTGVPWAVVVVGRSVAPSHCTKAPIKFYITYFSYVL
jgi:hypothetical protein